MIQSFRIWDTIGNTYTDTYKYVIDSDGDIMVISNFCEANYLGSQALYLEVEYSTDLRDMYKEILYDGDIVFNESIGKYGYIFFDDGKFQVYFGDCIYDLCECHMDCELKGNINENKELIV